MREYLHYNRYPTVREDAGRKDRAAVGFTFIPNRTCKKEVAIEANVIF